MNTAQRALAAFKSMFTTKVGMIALAAIVAVFLVLKFAFKMTGLKAVLFAALGGIAIFGFILRKAYGG